MVSTLALPLYQVYFMFSVFLFLSRLLCWSVCVCVPVHLHVHMCARVSGVSQNINEQITHDSSGMCDAVG